MIKIFRTSGACWFSDCDCSLYDGKEIDENNKPPLHDGCVCYFEEIEERKPIDKPQHIRRKGND